MRAAVVVFPGSNCDADTHWVLNEAAGIPADYVWHTDSDLSGYDAIVLPGGFSHGDYLRSGAVAARAPVMDAVRAAASSAACSVSSTILPMRTSRTSS